MANTYRVDAYSNPMNTSEFSGIGTYTENADVTLLSSPISGYGFVNWKLKGYTRLEYIRSSGTQYIDTNVVGSLDLKTEIKFNSQLIGESAIFGSAWTWNSNFLMFYENKLRWHSANSIDIPCSLNTNYVIKTENGKVVVNGTEYTNTPSTSVSTNQVRLFWTGDSRNLPKGQFKLYYFKMWKGTTLVRDYVPCLRHSDGAIGLFDMVDLKFYPNNGSGEFYGAFHYDPTEFDTLEYIESSGTQYINTNFKPNQSSAVQVDFEIVERPTIDACLFGQRSGAWNTSVNYSLWITNNNTFDNDTFDYNGVNVIPQQFPVGTRKIVKADKNMVYVNGENVFSKQAITFVGNYPIYLCCQNVTGTASYYSKVKIYACSIWDNETLVRDFVPSRRKADGVVGLFDMVNNEFYTNSGSGSFIGGNVL